MTAFPPTSSPPSRPASYALTGATGQLGQALLRELADQRPDLELFVLVRPGSTTASAPAVQSLFRRFRRVHLIEAALGNGQLSPAAARALGQAEGGLWHLAACTDLDHSSAATARCRSVNFEGTLQLLEAARRHPPRAFFHVSTAYVAHGRAPRNAYEATKTAAEDAVRSAFAEGLRGLIFRPSLILGPASPATGDVADLFIAAIRLALRDRRPALSLRLRPDAAMNIVDERQVARAMLAAAVDADRRRVVPLVASRPTRLGDVAGLLAARMPGFQIAFDDSLRSEEMDTSSRLLDRLLDTLRPYLHETEDAGLTASTPVGAVDWPALLAQRLGANAPARRASGLTPAVCG